MTRIRQDTETVHLLDAADAPLCGMEGGTGVPASEWAQGFVPASAGARVCTACEEVAGTAARFAVGEREREAREQGLPSMRPSGPGVPRDLT